jgi:L-threonylcarbamoyladenylate synthase
LAFTGWQLRAAARVVRAGGLIAYPTEAVYGLGCDPRSATAVARLLWLKGRPAAKGLILIAAAREQLDPFVDWAALAPERREEVFASWPGPVTWLLPARDAVPGWLHGGHPTIAVRVTAHGPVQALCRACGGPLVSTSANQTGRPPARTALAVRQIFGGEVDLILSGPLGGLDRPTEIREGSSGRVVRAG